MFIFINVFYFCLYCVWLLRNCGKRKEECYLFVFCVLLTFFFFGNILFVICLIAEKVREKESEVAIFLCFVFCRLFFFFLGIFRLYYVWLLRKWGKRKVKWLSFCVLLTFFFWEYFVCTMFGCWKSEGKGKWSGYIFLTSHCLVNERESMHRVCTLSCTLNALTWICFDPSFQFYFLFFIININIAIVVLMNSLNIWFVCE